MSKLKINSPIVKWVLLPSLIAAGIIGFYVTSNAKKECIKICARNGDGNFHFEPPNVKTGEFSSKCYCFSGGEFHLNQN
ncbi:hypothetical protein NBRC116492_35310 [Aurantivibrio infirmus]